MDLPHFVRKDPGVAEWPTPRRFRLGATSRPSSERSQRICPDLRTSGAFSLLPSGRTRLAVRTVPFGIHVSCPYRWKVSPANSTRQVNCAVKALESAKGTVLTAKQSSQRATGKTPRKDSASLEQSLRPFRAWPRGRPKRGSGHSATPGSLRTKWGKSIRCCHKTETSESSSAAVAAASAKRMKCVSRFMPILC